MQDTIDVVVTWAGTPLAVERLARGQKFTLGPAPSRTSPDTRHFLCDHPSIPADAFALAEHRADGVIVVRAAAEMDLMVNGRAVDLPELSLERSARAHVVIGPLLITIASDTRAELVTAKTRDLVDGRLVRISGVAMVLHAGFVVALLLTRAPDGLDDLARIAPDWRSIVTTPVRPSSPTAPSPTSSTPEQSAQTLPRASAPTSKTKPSPANEKGANRALAMNAIAQMFGASDARSSLFARDGGISAMDDLRGLRGARTAMGGDDVGIRRGPAGVGDGTTTIGVLHSGPIGDGGCTDCDVALTSRKKLRPEVKVESAIHDDGLSREEIQRVLNRVMAQIKYCYEKELNRDPDLQGKLVMNWVIGSGGLVTTLKSATSSLSGAGGSAVDSCVARVISRLQFPVPRGAQEVVVTYPFVVSSSGQ